MVTGASRGIGRSTALELANRGAKLALVARNPLALENVALEVKRIGVEVLELVCDVANFIEVEQSVTKTIERFGTLDILVNNAGTAKPLVRMVDADVTEWTNAIRINLIGAFHTCRAVLPHMLKRRSGILVNISSGLAVSPLDGASAYCASKAGLLLCTQTLAIELLGSGVRVHSFQPGMVDTDMQEEVRGSNIGQISHIPREQLTDPNEVARVIVWLCGAEADDLYGLELSILDPDLRRRVGF